MAKQVPDRRSGVVFSRRELATVIQALMVYQDLLGTTAEIPNLAALVNRHSHELLNEAELMALVVRLRSCTF